MYSQKGDSDETPTIVESLVIPIIISAAE